jgi:anti-anti-sigma factor
MSTTYYESKEAMVVARAEMTELVRGDEQRLVQRVAPLLREKDVALDLHKVDRIDAAGISALISLYSSARSAGHEFSVCNVSERVGEILSLVGLEPILVSHNAVHGSHCGPCYERSAA